MNHKIFTIFLLVPVIFLQAQKLNPVIDSTQSEIIPKIDFLKAYFSDTVNVKSYWLPKYSTTEYYNYSQLVDALTRNFKPYQALKKFDVEITELQSINDTLSYFKYMISASYDKHLVEYKLYLVNRNGTFFIENCKDLEKDRFYHFETPNITFYISKWREIDTISLNRASYRLDSIAKFLIPGSSIPHIQSYLCETVEEMNIITNMTHYYGFVGGFTHIENRFIVSYKAPPDYIHEFVHVILPPAAGMPNFFLGEGIASYLGGLSHHHSYQYGKEYLKDCFDSGRCTFDLLLARKIYNQYDNTPTYAFAAAICDYIITNYGYDYFFELYHNPDVNDTNVMDKICDDKNISKKRLIRGISQIWSD
jgi:hypothetical protein